MTNEILAHHGVLGMKWGVRRTPEQLARASGRSIDPKRRKRTNEPENTVSSKADKKSSGKSSDDELRERIAKLEKTVSSKKLNKESSPRKKTLSDLSDDELRERISRLELEKRYKDLEMANVKPKSTRGRDFCLNVLETIGKNTLTNIGTQAANHMLGEAINKLAGVSSDDKVKRVVNPQKGQEDKK